MRTGKATGNSDTEMSTDMMQLGSHVGVVVFDNLTFPDCFIFDEPLELVISPVINPIVHPSASVAFPDTFEVFHHDFVSVELGNDVFADVVVHPSHVTSFSTRELPEKSLCGTSAFGLEFAAQVFELPLDLLDFSGLVEPAVGTDGKVIYSEVNAENSSLRATVLPDGVDLFREREQEKASSFLIHPKETFGDAPTEIIFVAVGDCERELLSAFEQPQYQDIAFDICTAWEIVPYRSALDEWLGLGFLDHATRLFQASDSDLSREPEPLSDLVVDSMMEFEVLCDFMLPSVINTELQGSRVSIDSCNYLRGWLDTDFCCDSCSHPIGEDTELYKVSPPTAKAVGIRNEGFL